MSYDIDFVYQNLEQVCPLPPEDVGDLKIKITSERGETNWLSITPNQFKLVENVLLNIKMEVVK